MQILLTNDDGIFAPGLEALELELARLGDVCVVAPATEQSGVGHSITYLSPLLVRPVTRLSGRRAWAVEGSPADCVKVAIFDIAPKRPDLVVSGINGGLNAGINILYSGTVAAAVEGAFYDITSFAVSLEYHPEARFDRAAMIARSVIEKALEQKGPGPQLYNINIPTAALSQPIEECVAGLKVVPMGVQRMGEAYEKRQDPRGRNYYWAINDSVTFLPDDESDLSALLMGHVTLTPLNYDLTKRAMLQEMKSWNWRIE